MVEKKQKKNYEIVMDGQMKDCFNEIFIDWTTTNKAKKILNSGRYATIHDYKRDFRKLGYIEIEGRPFIDKNGRKLSAVTQIRGTLKPYFDYLKNKKINISSDFKSILEILFEDKSLRKSIINRGGNIINGINYFIQLSLIAYPYKRLGKKCPQIICSNFIIKLKREKFKFNEIINEFVTILNENNRLTDDEKFYLYISLLNGIFFETILLEKNIIDKFSKLILFIKDFKMCNLTPSESPEVFELYDHINNKFMQQLKDSNKVEDKELYKFYKEYSEHPENFTIEVETIK